MTGTGGGYDDMRRQIEERVVTEEQMLADAAAQNPDDDALPDGDGQIDADYVQQCFVCDELGDSLLFNRLHRGKYVCNLVSGEWLHFVGPHWDIDYREANAKAAVEDVVDLYLEHIYEAVEQQLAACDPKDKARLKNLRARRKQVVDRIANLRRDYKKNALLKSAVSNREPLSIHHRELDQHPWLFPAANGVLDLRSGQFFEGGRPEDYLTICSPTPWLGSDVPAPRWEAFLLEILGGDHDMVRYLQKILGYSITGLRMENLFIVFYGPHGRNGKSTLLTVLRLVLGEMVSKINTEMLMSQKFAKSASGPSPDVMDMKNKRIVWASETEKGQSFAHGKVKEFSGGDTLKGRGLNDKYMTEFEPSHVLYLLCNDRPKAPAHDNAFWSRIRVFTFPYSFEPVVTEPHQRQANINIEAELMSEAPGILAWLVKGVQLWRDEGERVPDSVSAASQSYRASVDDLQDWIDARCLVDMDDAGTGNREFASTLYKSYRDFWEDNNTTRAMNSKDFSDQMQAKGFTKIKSGRVCYQYIRLNVTGEGN